MRVAPQFLFMPSSSRPIGDSKIDSRATAGAILEGGGLTQGRMPEYLRGLTFCFLALVTVLCFNATEAKAGWEWGTAKSLPGAARDDRVRDVAFDGMGNATALLIAGRSVETSVRPAGGIFGTPEPISTSEVPQYAPVPKLAENERGDAVAVWVTNTPPNFWPDAAVRVATRLGGGSFGPALTLLVGSSFDPQGTLDAGIDSLGNVTVIAGSDTVVVFEKPAGRPFGSGHFLYNARTLGSVQGKAQLAVNGRGDAVVAIRGRDSGRELVGVSKSGETLGPVEEIGPTGGGGREHMAGSPSTLEVMQRYFGANIQIAMSCLSRNEV